MKKALLSVCFLALLAAGCKKDKDEAKAVQKEDLVGTYVITSIKAQPGTASELDLAVLYLDDCQEDDTYTLKNDGTYTVNDNALTCPDTPEGGTWDFSNNKFTFDGLGEEFDLKSWNGKTLVVQDEVSFLGASQTVEVVFTKQ